MTEAIKVIVFELKYRPKYSIIFFTSSTNLSTPYKRMSFGLVDSPYPRIS